MNSIGITMTSLAVAIGLWLAWLLSKPSVQPMLDSRSEQALSRMRPPDDVQGNKTTFWSTFTPLNTTSISSSSNSRLTTSASVSATPWPTRPPRA